MRRHTIGATIAAATATGAMAIAGETIDAATTIASTGYGPTVRPTSARAGCALGAGGACFVHARRADIEPDARDCQRSFGAGERKGAQGAIALCSFASSDRSPFP
ncbi:pirin [Burkholderia pseudomallei]|uniref:pirin n=1 Tax=Burkholderia pseudomallei TaxID=28450 RepID=UPI0015C2DFD8|nr:pirin [Burkholderia pseudomallei]MDA0560386.1 pirin [Burkholderia pseudomallei]